MESPAPVFALFRQILRVHRALLPGPVRNLGDAYAKSEFRSHLRNPKTSRPQWEEFFKQWRGYVDTLTGQEDSSEALLRSAADDNSTTGAARLEDYLSPEQQLRMEALRKEASQLGETMLTPEEASSGEAVHEPSKGQPGKEPTAH